MIINNNLTVGLPLKNEKKKTYFSLENMKNEFNNMIPDKMF